MAAASVEVVVAVVAVAARMSRGEAFQATLLGARSR
jgi:hypothetical protein